MWNLVAMVLVLITDSVPSVEVLVAMAMTSILYVLKDIS